MLFRWQLDGRHLNLGWAPEHTSFKGIIYHNYQWLGKLRLAYTLYYTRRPNYPCRCLSSFLFLSSVFSCEWLYEFFHKQTVFGWPRKMLWLDAFRNIFYQLLCFSILFSNDQENCCNFMHFVIFFVSFNVSTYRIGIVLVAILYRVLNALPNVCLHFMDILSGLETLMMNRILDELLQEHIGGVKRSKRPCKYCTLWAFRM